MANNNLNNALDAGYDKNEVFGLAISGAHYSDRDSHAWVYLATYSWNAYMHFTIAKNSNREEVARVVSDRVCWFMNACMLTNRSWTHNIDDIKASLATHHIDVLYAPGLSDIERLSLLCPGNPLVYDNGKFQRVTDYVRQYQLVYPGAFNPPTKHHLSVPNVLYEISQQHCHKGSLSTEDLMHRMRMFSAEGVPVMLTHAPRFVDKNDEYVANGAGRYTFLQGADAWNNMIAAHQYPSDSWLGNRLENADFMVIERDGIEIQHNAVSQHLRMTVMPASIYADYSSTAVRNSPNPGEHFYLTPAVAEYVKKHNLYLTSERSVV